MEVIGFTKARNLMRQLDWKALVTMDGDKLTQVVLYHPKQPNRYKVRLDSAKKLLKECVVEGSETHETAIVGYDRGGEPF